MHEVPQLIQSFNPLPPLSEISAIGSHSAGTCPRTILCNVNTNLYHNIKYYKIIQRQIISVKYFVNKAIKVKRVFNCYLNESWRKMLPLGGINVK